MKGAVHIANTNVEFEWESPLTDSLEIALSYYPLCLQLQFLPLLFAKKEDLIAVTSLPSPECLERLKQVYWWKEEFPRFVLLKEEEPFIGRECLSWGPSLQVQAWANKRKMRYLCPNIEIARLVNDKAFSFRYTCLKEASLIRSEQELEKWFECMNGAKVLKASFGLSGRGNWIVQDREISSKLLKFCQNEWQCGRPILAEPWLNRIKDFSTQWFIHEEGQIEWIGATLFKTDSKGSYQGTLAGPQELLFGTFQHYLEEHLQFVHRALEEIRDLGFFGSLGIDAFIYRDVKTEGYALYPLVEINGRKTMSWVALQLQQVLCPDLFLHLNFEKSIPKENSLLPDQLIDFKGKTIFFQRNLSLKIDDKFDGI